MNERSTYQPASQARGVLVSFSPKAGARSGEKRSREVASALESAGFRVRMTSDLAELQDLAAEWHAEGQLRCVIAAGGDGSAAIVRNRISLEIPLLPLPLGTENLLGRYVSQSPEPAAIVRTVGEGLVVPLDLGRYHADGAEPRYFLTMISAGFDAEVVRRLHEGRQGNIARHSYVGPALAAIRSYAYPEIQLYCDQDSATRPEPLTSRWAFCFNLPLYACGWQIAPEADGSDGLFDVCTFRNGSLRHVAWYLWHVIRERHFQLADAQRARGRTLRMESATADRVPYQVDGDFGGMLPVEIEVLPGQLRLLVMPAVAERLGFTAHE